MATMVNAQITSLMDTLVNAMTLLTHMLMASLTCKKKKKKHLPWQL
jgi:hypothetical protein